MLLSRVKVPEVEIWSVKWRSIPIETTLIYQHIFKTAPRRLSVNAELAATRWPAGEHSEKKLATEQARLQTYYGAFVFAPAMSRMSTWSSAWTAQTIRRTLHQRTNQGMTRSLMKEVREDGGVHPKVRNSESQTTSPLEPF